MRCDEIRPHLPDHVLGTLDEDQETAVRRHLRGCGACRSEAATLDEGLRTLASATHAVAPPPEIRERVQEALSREWAEDAPHATATRPRRQDRWLLAAALVALTGAVAWGVSVQLRANRATEQAIAYQRFLDALGGTEVRVARLAPLEESGVRGSAVLYDSHQGQSWVLVLVRAPGWSGTLTAAVTSPSGERIRLFPIELGRDGDGSTWLVTANDLASFDRVELWSDDGTMVATGTTEGDD